MMNRLVFAYRSAYAHKFTLHVLQSWRLWTSERTDLEHNEMFVPLVLRFHPSFMNAWKLTVAAVPVSKGDECAQNNNQQRILRRRGGQLLKLVFVPNSVFRVRLVTICLNSRYSMFCASNCIFFVRSITYVCTYAVSIFLSEGCTRQLVMALSGLQATTVLN